MAEQDKVFMGGRKIALTTDDLLKAIYKYKTESPTELAMKLNVSRRTVHRRLNDIDPAKIEAIFKELAMSDLSPEQTEYDVFVLIPEVEAFREKLEVKRKVSKRYSDGLLRSLWRMCVHLKRHPDKLTIEEAGKLVSDIETGKVKNIGIESTKKTIRSWFENRGVSGQLLTAEGVDGSASRGSGKRSRIKLSAGQRKRFIQVLTEKTKKDYKGKSTLIHFEEHPNLVHAILVLPKFLYYTGTRKTAMLEATWDKLEDYEWKNPINTIEVLDKGLHRKGRKRWFKRLAGDFREEMMRFWNAVGQPKEGRIFPFTDNQLYDLFGDCYVEAGIPEKVFKGMPLHIWRHTACQDLLEATNYNYDKVGEILGWENIETMKKHYGKVGESVIEKSLLEAMGIKVEWEKKEFKF